MRGIHRKIELAVQRLNALRGKRYPDVGSLYYADVKGDGRFRPRLYVSCNPQGGLVLSAMNCRTYSLTLLCLEFTAGLTFPGAPITNSPGFDGRKS